jgi:hypothetical protein
LAGGLDSLPSPVRGRIDFRKHDILVLRRIGRLNHDEERAVTTHVGEPVKADRDRVSKHRARRARPSGAGLRLRIGKPARVKPLAQLMLQASPGATKIVSGDGLFVGDDFATVMRPNDTTLEIAGGDKATTIRTLQNLILARRSRKVSLFS